MKKTIIFLIVMLIFAGCGKMNKDGRAKQELDWASWYNDDEASDDGKPGIMIMSFNVRLASASEDTGDKNWSKRRAGCYEMLKTIRPQLMGVQECQPTQKSDLRNNSDDLYEVWGESRDGSANGEQMAIYYLKDSVTLLDSKTFWLSQTPATCSKYSQAEHYRCATWTKFRHNTSGKEFCYINTHLDLVPEARAYEMVVMMEQVASRCGDLPVILSADWNTTEDDAIFDEMYQTFSNARWTAKTGDSYGTFNGFSNPNSSTKIDHIFYRGFSSCSRFTTVRQKWAGYQFISDHYPVYAKLKF